MAIHAGWIAEGRSSSAPGRVSPVAMSINTNVSALNAQRQAANSSKMLNRVLQQMGSGLRINKAADDAAGLAISESFTSQIRQAQTESSNYQSGYNMAQTADSGLETQQDAIQRVRELAVQASNGTLSADQRQALNTEAQQLLSQVDETAKNTEFNGQKLIDQNRSVQLDAQGSTQLQMNASTNAALGTSGIDLSTAQGAQSALDAADQALQRIGQNRSNIGAQMNRFESAINSRDIQVQNAQASQSQIRDADTAKLVMERTRSDIMTRTGLSALMQSNVTNGSALTLLGR